MLNNILLFDSGYLFFYRYHATMKYLKFRGELSTYDIIQELFLKHLEDQIIKIKSRIYYILYGYRA